MAYKYFDISVSIKIIMSLPYVTHKLILFEEEKNDFNWSLALRAMKLINKFG